MRAFHVAELACLLVAASLQPPVPPKDGAADKDAPPAAPARVTAAVGSSTAFRVEGDELEYRTAFDARDCEFIQLCVPGEAHSKLTYFFVSPQKPGQYAVMFSRKGSTRGALCVIDAGTPVPPKPPTPPPPPIDDKIRLSLRAAYVRDGGSTGPNEEARKLLAELYRQAADLVTTAESPDALLQQLRRASSALADDRLTETRTAIAEEVGVVLALGMAFTDANRRQAAALFAKLAVALDW